VLERILEIAEVLRGEEGDEMMKPGSRFAHILVTEMHSILHFLLESSKHLSSNGVHLPQTPPPVARGVPLPSPHSLLASGHPLDPVLFSINSHSDQGRGGKILVITTKLGVIRGHQAPHDFWGRRNCSPPRSPIPHYAADSDS